MCPSPRISTLSPRRRVMLVAAACLVPAFCFGALSWDTQKIEITTKPGDSQAVGIFPFVNSGNAPVTITSVQPSCGCTTAELAKRTYAPGEKGEIKAVFTLGDRVGEQEKIINVTTAEAPGKPVPLMLHVTIPELLVVSPRLLLWRMAEVLAEKSTIVTATSPQKITSIEVNPALHSDATIRIETLEPGTKYRIAVLPASTAQAANLTVSLLVRFADSTTHSLNVYVLVK